MTYKPVPLDQAFKTFEEKGWYKLRVDKGEIGRSSGGYSQIHFIMIVEGGEYEGCQVHYFFLIPTIEKAYKTSKDQNGEPHLDRNKPEYWMLRTGWFLQVFGMDIGKGDEVKNLKMLQLEKPLQTACDKVIGKYCVGYIEPKPYSKTFFDKDTGEEKTVTRIAGNLTEIREADYQPEAGFVTGTPTPPVRQPEHNSTDITPEMSRNPADVPLDPDTDLEEDEDFFV